MTCTFSPYILCDGREKLAVANRLDPYIQQSYKSSNKQHSERRINGRDLCSHDTELDERLSGLARATSGSRASEGCLPTNMGTRDIYSKGSIHSLQSIKSPACAHDIVLTTGWPVACGAT